MFTKVNTTKDLRQIFGNNSRISNLNIAGGDLKSYLKHRQHISFLVTLDKFFQNLKVNGIGKCLKKPFSYSEPSNSYSHKN